MTEADNVSLGASCGWHEQHCCVQKETHKAFTLRRKKSVIKEVHILSVTERLFGLLLILKVENHTELDI